MKSQGMNLQVISDGYPRFPRKERIRDIDVLRLEHLQKPPKSSAKLEALIHRLNPNVVVQLMGLTSFLTPKFYENLKIPLIGILTSPIYKISEIARIGLKEIILNIDWLFIHIIGSMIPKLFIRRANSSIIYKFVVLSEKNRRRLIRLGICEQKVVCIPPGLEPEDLCIPYETRASKRTHKEATLGKKARTFQILYLGSPLSLRGIDTVIKAFSKVASEFHSCNLKILSRLDSANLKRKENKVRNLCLEEGVDDSVVFLSGVLSKEQVRKHILESMVVVLPFKIVMSDMPISILESMALGLPVISTRVDGISELLSERRGMLIDVGDYKQLAKAIIMLYRNEKLRKELADNAKQYMYLHPRWKTIKETFSKIVMEAKR
jgi:glycosyltransferase involved in cell wall biosynthesis